MEVKDAFIDALKEINLKMQKKVEIWKSNSQEQLHVNKLDQ